jgi:hypothetical protein
MIRSVSVEWAIVCIHQLGHNDVTANNLQELF